jgi:hypothetical protein
LAFFIIPRSKTLKYLRDLSNKREKERLRAKTLGLIVCKMQGPKHPQNEFERFETFERFEKSLSDSGCRYWNHPAAPAQILRTKAAAI